METKTKSPYFEGKVKDDVPKIGINDEGKFVKQFEEAADKAMTRSKIVEIRFIGVEFDYKKVRIGQDIVNRTLAEGFQPLKDIITESGLVLIMVKRDEESCPI
ncbi:hypothetical protein OAJ50_00750 [Candidatus Nitrosopelagicus sp.]|nr:hypothetical protein [Candidatus Nitrosopelagicus sp.]